MKKMGQAAYKDYLEHYTPESNYKILMEIYNKTIDQFQTLNQYKIYYDSGLISKNYKTQTAVSCPV